jgi:hypothetical protein
MASAQPMHQQPRAAQPAEPAQEKIIESQQIIEQLSIAPLREDMHAGSYGMLQYGLPWWLLILLGCMFYASLYVQQLQVYVQQILERIVPAYMRRRFFAQIKKELARAAGAQDYHALQQLLTQVVARQMQRAPELIDQEAMLAYVAASSWSLEKKQRWQQFLQRLHEHLYAQHADAHDAQLFAATELWLDEFERNA